MMRYIGLSQRICLGAHQEKRDCLAHDWTVFLAAAGLRWVALPNNTTVALNMATELDLCGLVLTGGDDMGVFLERDQTEYALLDWSRKQHKPVVGVCRGFQIMHTWLGGVLTAVKPGQHVATRHLIRFNSGGGRQVNSYHTFAPAVGLECNIPMKPLAFCEDDESIEAAQGEQLFGMMWHPEREELADARDISLFQHYFPEACYD